MIRIIGFSNYPEPKAMSRPRKLRHGWCERGSESGEGDSEGQSSQNALRRARSRLLRFLKIERRSLKVPETRNFDTIRYPRKPPPLAHVFPIQYSFGPKLPLSNFSLIIKIYIELSKKGIPLPTPKTILGSRGKRSNWTLVPSLQVAARTTTLVNTILSYPTLS